MADKKISALTGASTPLAGTEVLPIVQSGATVKVSVANLTVGRAVATAGGSFTDNITQSTAAKGVNFTANTPAAGMTSQLLNWYEEGTFTPTLTTDGSPSTTYGNRTGTYTRIGNVVYIQIGIEWTAFSGTGNVQIGGLPFAVSFANPAKTIAISITYSTVAALANYCLADFRTSGSSTSLYLYSFTGGTIGTAGVGASGTMTFKGFYFI